MCFEGNFSPLRILQLFYNPASKLKREAVSKFSSILFISAEVISDIFFQFEVEGLRELQLLPNSDKKSFEQNILTLKNGSVFFRQTLSDSTKSLGTGFKVEVLKQKCHQPWMIFP